MTYAATTTVPVDRSQMEIRKILSKYNAAAFAFAENLETAMVQFEMNGKRIKFMLPLGVYNKTKNKKGWILSKEQIAQFNRSRWRGLVLAIKAKLECVEAGITTFEQEFMAHILLPNGQTVGDAVLPEIENSYRGGPMPPLLGMR